MAYKQVLVPVLRRLQGVEASTYLQERIFFPIASILHVLCVARCGLHIASGGRLPLSAAILPEGGIPGRHCSGLHLPGVPVFQGDDS